MAYLRVDHEKASLGRRLRLGLAVALVVAPWPANADISVSPAVVVIETDAPRDRTMIVTNDGGELAFVTAKPRAVTAPGEKDEKLRPEANPALLGLLVNPLRLVLEPGERRGLNLLAVTPPGEADRVWRVQVAPAVGKLKPGQSGIAFVVAYDALVIQRAANPRPSVTGARNRGSLTLVNAGNSFALVNQVSQCSGNRCTNLPGKRLYAGQSWTVALPNPDDPVELTIDGVGGRREKLRF